MLPTSRLNSALSIASAARESGKAGERASGGGAGEQAPSPWPVLTPLKPCFFPTDDSSTRTVVCKKKSQKSLYWV